MTREELENSAELKVVAYITAWCPDCTRSRRVIQRMGIPFTEIDIEKISDAEEEMRALNGGSGKVPTILIENSFGRRILIEPGDRELADALRGCQPPS
jgi:mycoredoxin